MHASSAGPALSGVAGLWLPPTAAPAFSPALRNAILASIVIHAAILSLRFTFPDPSRLRNVQTLEVVLVNAKSSTRPTNPDAIAQANLDRGGDTDENRRAATPLPVMPEPERGDNLKRARKRVAQLEAKQRQLMTQPQTQAAISVQPTKPEPSQEPQPVSGADLLTSTLALARLEAQIARQVDEYNKRPRKHFVGARTAESRFAQYVEDWRLKIERIGNLNYPDGARGRIYGSLRLTVSLKPDGTVDDVQIDRPSEYKILNDAALKIVRLAAPFAPFPADIRRDTDILVITRTWTFAPGDRLFDN